MTTDPPAAAPLVLGQEEVTPEAVVAVAAGRPVTLGATAVARMEQTREVIEQALERGDPVYGVTRGVGVLKTIPLAVSEQLDYNRSLCISHNVGSGPIASEAQARAAMVVRAAGLSLGYAGVRPRVAEALCAALNARVIPRLHTIGSVGQADLSQMAEIGLLLAGQGGCADALRRAGLQPLEFGPREAHAILNANAYTVGVACLALSHARRSLDALERAAALSYEAVLGNVDALHAEISAARRYAGDERSRRRLRELLAGGSLDRRETLPRNLQDALCFKGLTQTHGSCWDAFDHLEGQLSIELASSGDSPLVVLDEGRAISTGGHEIAPVGLALDHARLAFAGPVTIASERIQKLLDPRFTDLPAGLRSQSGSARDGLAIVGHGAAAVAAEARMLAAPVMLELPTSSIAEGIEDRVTMAPVAAARLQIMSELVLRLAATELVCAAQAIDLRGSTELGTGTATVYRTVRGHVPGGELTLDSGQRIDRLAAQLVDERTPAGVSPQATHAGRPPSPVIDQWALDELAKAPGPLAPAECAARARRAAGALEVSGLDRGGSGEAVLLWRSDSSEAWLNLWWSPRDTGYHDHDGSCVGVHVIAGVARNEALMFGAARQVHEYRAGDAFSFPNAGIHRMEHDAGTITVHVYSPPIRSLGHYELVDGMLQRRPGRPDEPSPPSPELLGAARTPAERARGGG